MNLQKLETAVRLNLDLTVLVLRDNAYGMIKWKQAHMRFVDFGNPDVVRYAEYYGARGHRAEKADELVSLMEDCYATPGVHLVDVPMDYSDNDRILNKKIVEKNRAA